MNTLDELADQPIKRSPMSSSQIALAVEALGTRWTHDGSELKLTFAGPMTRTGKIAAHAGALADELDHHPTITMTYPGLTLAINTHDKAAVTVLDVIYAARLERWLRNETP
ncbi:MAG TPA: 4a-hydroxytetrahydrobiopterin dehydratase [Kofleriaceae bacterium]|jgi:4a-hydroxytetrahydrobiopterin dehydratase